MERKQRWQDWVNLFLGAWIFVMPFFGIGALSGAVAWNGYVFGAIIALLSAIALYKPQAWEEWINWLIGLWLIASPFVMGFSEHTTLMWNYVVVGLVIAGDALWAALERPMHPPHEPHHA